MSRQVKFVAAMIVGIAVAAIGPANAAPPPKAPSFQVVTDIPYTTGNNPAQQLDLYLPIGAKSFATVIFVHGGSWSSGHKNIYAHIGRHFATQGIAAAIIGYRLTPEVVHPEHVRDVAAATAWVRDNIAAYGGNNDRLFLCGHSAGGHLVTLLATDPEYLKPYKMAPTDLQGVISLSGIYSLDSTIDLTGVARAFKNADRKTASPVCLIQKDKKCPPILLLYGEKDVPTFDKQARELHRLLKEANVLSDIEQVDRADHVGIIIDLCVPGNNCGKKIVDWVNAR